MKGRVGSESTFTQLTLKVKLVSKWIRRTLTVIITGLLIRDWLNKAKMQ